MWVALRVTPSNPSDVSTRGDLKRTLQPEDCSEVPCSGQTNAPDGGLEPFREPAARKAAGTKAVCECAEALAAWIFQASPEFSNVRSAVRSLDEAVWLVRQFKEEIKPGDTAYLWLSGRRGGIIGVAEVLEVPRIQAEPREQIPFIRKTEKFAGDQLRVKLRLLKRIQPVIPRTYLRSRAELSKLSILRCPRGTNFRVSREEAEILKTLVASHMATPLVRNAAGSEKRVIFAEE